MAYPSDVPDEDWAFVVQYLTFMDFQVLQQGHDLRRHNGLR
jgi:hypothetical protein